MRKFSKVQDSAEIRVGRRWEYAIGNLLKARRVKFIAQTVLEGFGHEADLLVSSKDGSPDTLVSVVHVSQRNNKDKFYRILDELCLFKSEFPEKRKVLLYIGEFLAEQGWPQLLTHFFDGVLILSEHDSAERLTELVVSISPLSKSHLSTKEASQIVRSANLDDIVDTLIETIAVPLKNRDLWSKLSTLVAHHQDLATNDSGLRIQCKKQTRIRQPLLASICIPPRLRPSFVSASRVKLTVKDAKVQEMLGTLNVSNAISGKMAYVSPDTLKFLRDCIPQVDAFENAIRNENAIYASYLDDLHEPERLKEVILKFQEEIGKTSIKPKELISLMRRVRLNQVSLSSGRPTNWALELALIHADLSRNELDKRAAAVSSKFPNARNVTGRYIYGTLKDTTRLPLETFEKLVGSVLGGVAMLHYDEVLLKYVEDRRYGIAIIQKPRPLASAVKAAVDTAFASLGWRVTHNPSVSTLLTMTYEQLTGNSAGRLGVVPFQAVAERGKKRVKKVFVRALSAFNGRSDKVKELAAKIILIRLREIAEGDIRSIFVIALDGDLSADNHKELISAGYDYVVSIPELQKVLKSIASRKGAKN